MTINSPRDTASLSVEGQDAVSPSDRRQDERHFHGMEVVVLLPGDDSPVGTPRNWTKRQAWSRNVSKSGINFLCLEKIEVETVFVRAAGPAEEVAEIQITRRTERISGLWEYGGFVRRVFPQSEL